MEYECNSRYSLLANWGALNESTEGDSLSEAESDISG
jgi:hypothetical protein